VASSLERTELTNVKPLAWLTAMVAGLFCTLGGAVAAHAQPVSQLEVLYAFDPQTGVGSVLQAADGDFYGLLGSSTSSVVFRIKRDTHAFAVLHDFDPTGALGGSPSSLIQASDGNLYGTTYYGGVADCGTVFRLTLAGAYTVLHEFPCGGQGKAPAALIEGSDGAFYGVTVSGGTGRGTGVLFQTLANGTTTVVFNFNLSGDPLNSGPRGLMQGRDGWFYVISYSFGEIGPFSSTYLDRVNLAGTLEHIDGAYGVSGAPPLPVPVQGSDGRLYYSRTGPHDPETQPRFYEIVAFSNGVKETITSYPTFLRDLVEVAPGTLFVAASDALIEVPERVNASPTTVWQGVLYSYPTLDSLFNGRDGSVYGLARFDVGGQVHPALVRLPPSVTSVTLELSTGASGAPATVPLYGQPTGLVAGQPTTWTVHGGPGLEYKFWIYGAAGWRVLQDYSDASHVLHWSPARAGDYILQVWVRRAGSTAPWDAVQTTTVFSVAAAPPPTIAAVTVTPTLPTETGTPVTIHATATDGIDPLQYQFWLLDPVTGWRLLQAWGTANMVAWVPQNVGNHVIQVWVRSAGSTAAYDTWQGLGPFTVAAGPLTVTDLTPSYPLPAAPSVPVTWTASTVGGTGQALEFQFYRFSAATQTWALVESYSPSSTWTWTPSAGDLGTYHLQVWTRRVGSPLAWEAWRGTEVFTVAATPLTIALTSNQTGTDPEVDYPDVRVPPGTPIVWSAVANAPPGAVEYQFWRFDASAGLWSLVQPYSLAGSYAWTPSVADTGRWALQVWARPVGSTLPFTAWNASYIAVQP